jgi:UNC-50 family
MTQSSVVSPGDFVEAAFVDAADSIPETTSTDEDSNDNEDDNEMSSEATHSRKSRLAVPAGGDDAVPASSLAGGGGGSGCSSSTAGGTGLATTTTNTASSSSAGASGSASGLPLLSRKHRHGTAAGGASGGLGGMTSTTGLLLSSSHLRPMHYFSRLTDVRQMDIQSALDQMKTLLSTRPQVVYKTSYYRKQTKNHWARDDPAFCALQALFLLVAAIAYSVAFRCTITGAISFILYAVIWNWLGMGLLLATTCREIANRQLNNSAQQPISVSHVRQQVEWLYAFDIHCNAFFPVFVVLCK